MTDEMIREEVLKYNSRTEFSTAYKKTSKRGLEAMSSHIDK